MSRHAPDFFYVVALSLVVFGCAHRNLPHPAGDSIATHSFGAAHDDFFGERVDDPYRWLEQLDSPDSRAWIHARAEEASRTLDAVRGIGVLRQELLSLSTEPEIVANLRAAGGNLFYLRRQHGETATSLYVRRPNGVEQSLLKVLDSKDTPTAIEFLSPSSDGRLIAFESAERGTEDRSIHVFDALDGREVARVGHHVSGVDVSWVPGRHSFYYTSFPHFDDAQHRRDTPEARLLAIEDNTTKDTLVVRDQTDQSLPLPANAFPMIRTTAGSDFELAVVYRGSSDEARIYSRRSRHSLEDSTEPWHQIVDYSDAVASWAVVANELFVISRRTAAFGALMRINLCQPDNMTSILTTPTSGAKFVGVVGLKASLLLVEEDLKGSHIRRFGIGNGHIDQVTLPFDGTLSDYSANSDADEAFFLADGWTDSPRWIRVEEKVVRGVEVFPNLRRATLADLQVEHVEATSADGTRVPMTILSRSGTPRDGSAPTILSGYGAYEVSLEPYYNEQRIPWLERGGLVAIAHVRGGGELGREWHLAAMRDHKRNSVDDFLACADYLLREKYTVSGRLAAAGGSAGGIVIASAMVRRPDLFNAVYIDGGIVDILRWLGTPNGIASQTEFGAPDTKGHFEYLRDLDAYQQIEAGVHYPAVFVVGGLNDVRVPAWQGAKLVAKLKDVARGGPFLLQLDEATGHERDSISQVARSRADFLAFLWWRMGL